MPYLPVGHSGKSQPSGDYAGSKTAPTAKPAIASKTLWIAGLLPFLAMFHDIRVIICKDPFTVTIFISCLFFLLRMITHDKVTIK